MVSIISNLILLFMAAFVVLFPFYLIVFFMKRSVLFTQAKTTGCTEETCIVTRVERPGWLKKMDFISKTRKYKCKTCKKEFIRLKP